MTKRTCTADGCAKAHKARGFCHNHYYAAKKRGDLPVVMPMHSDPDEAFASRTERRGDCLVWTGAKTLDGYGQLGVRGKMTRAHRYAWERERGPVPEGMWIDHTCYEPSCCEVSHLRLADAAQNGQNRNGAMPGSSTGVRNVYRNGKGFRAAVRKDGRGHTAGTYSTIEEAAVAAEKLRAELFGEFAGRG